jgi:hypothetical protein
MNRRLFGKNAASLLSKPNRSSFGRDDKARFLLITPNYTDGKHLYGMSFVLYGGPRPIRQPRIRKPWNSRRRRFIGSTSMATTRKTVATSNGSRARARWSKAI